MCPKLTIGLGETRIGIAAPLWIQISMRNVLPPRETERALTLGTMFTTDEAAKNGLIDEVANDKQDAIKRCENFLLQFNEVSPDARALTKIIFRGKDIADLENNRKEDWHSFFAQLTQPKVQEELGLHLTNLKTKKIS